MLAFDHLDRQIQSRRAAGARHPASIDDEQAGFHSQIRESIAERRFVLPVDGRSMARQQSGPGKQERTA